MAFEIFHSLRKRCNGRKGWMALKLDINKAYDRVEWCFLEAMMKKMEFVEKWIRVVMNCISSVRFSFVVNGCAKGIVVPHRGLKQGCALSPYLFLLCAEGFSSLIQKAKRNKEMLGFACTKRYPRVSYLVFVDDSLIFYRENVTESRTIKDILETYANALGSS